MLGIEYKSLVELIRAFPDDESCLEYLEAARWGDKVVSPFDPTSKVYRCKGHKFYCKNTGKYFNALTGTFLENTKVSLTKWMMAVWLLSAAKKGVSSYQLARDIGVTQKTAWFILHRIRKCLADTETVLDGEVEMDETFVGGKNKNRHWNKKVKNCQGRAHLDKTPVFGMVERGGHLAAQVIPDTSQQSITPVVLQRVSRNATIFTDEWMGYDKLDKLYNRWFIDHSRGQYVDGNITTNRIEGFWGIFKRGIIGVYQMATRKHLQKYVDEFVWRYNTRLVTQGQRFSMFFANFDSRLRYKDLVYA